MAFNEEAQRVSTQTRYSELVLGDDVRKKQKRTALISRKQKEDNEARGILGIIVNRKRHKHLTSDLEH